MCCYFARPSYLQVFRGTITAAPDFDPSADGETLYNAMKGFGECPPLLPMAALKYRQAVSATLVSNLESCLVLSRQRQRGHIGLNHLKKQRAEAGSNYSIQKQLWKGDVTY